jgi:hypothetical protein
MNTLLLMCMLAQREAAESELYPKKGKVIFAHMYQETLLEVRVASGNKLLQTYSLQIQPSPFKHEVPQE